jgi:hypothetical protein
VTPLRGAHYPGVRLRASGRYSSTGVRQAIEVIAIRRVMQVTYTLAAFRNARARAVIYSGAVAVMLRSFRAQPPQF